MTHDDPNDPLDEARRLKRHADRFAVAITALVVLTVLVLLVLAATRGATP